MQSQSQSTTPAQRRDCRSAGGGLDGGGWPCLWAPNRLVTKPSKSSDGQRSKTQGRQDLLCDHVSPVRQAQARHRSSKGPIFSSSREIRSAHPAASIAAQTDSEGIAFSFSTSGDWGLLASCVWQAGGKTCVG
jgi:hypothetical protein